MVQNSWGGEELYLPKDIGGGLEFSGWIREDALRRLLSSRRIDLDRLYRAFHEKKLPPVPLELRMKIECRSRLREVRPTTWSRDSGKKRKRIVLLAHIDHLGRNPALEGDQIFNGAVDNGSAVAALMLTTPASSASAVTASAHGDRPGLPGRRGGLLGSMHYVMNTDLFEHSGRRQLRILPGLGGEPEPDGVGARFFHHRGDAEGNRRRRRSGVHGVLSQRPGLLLPLRPVLLRPYNIPAVWISAGEETVNGTNTLATSSPELPYPEG